ncbi:hypothetical protein LJB75_00910, partial [Bacteroidales bacterium OttesenSCG-928-L19]|nr:hypothetical protein [Bacteroidales bacterium OttesenSCG-928-L19]
TTYFMFLQGEKRLILILMLHFQPKRGDFSPRPTNHYLCTFNISTKKETDEKIHDSTIATFIPF